MKITICICTFRRDPLLRRLLQALKDIELSDQGAYSVDILVVNNDPNPSTRELCREEASSLPFPINYVEEGNPGLVNARNRAVSEAIAAGADAIAFLDDDDVPDRDWLAQLLSVYVQSDADIVAGDRRFSELPPWSEGAWERRVRKSMDKEVGLGRFPRGAATCNVLIGRDILGRLSTAGSVFRAEFAMSGGEDKDLFLRADKLGAKILFAEKSFVTQFNENDRYTTKGLFRRGFKAGCSKMNLTLAHDRRSKACMIATTTFVKLIVGLVLLPFSLFSEQRRLGEIYRLGKSFGILYFALTGRSMKYYYHDST